MNEAKQNHKFKPSKYNWCFSYHNEYDIWFNGFTQAAILADSQTSANIKKVLNSEKLSDSSDPVVLRQTQVFTNMMHTAGFIIDCEFNELDALRIRHLNGRIVKNYDIGLTIAPTMGCNLDCPYCYAFKDPNSRMSPSIRDAVVYFAEKLIQHNKAEKLSVSWVGGEPLVAFDVLEELTNRFLELCSKYDCKYSHYLTTNGVLLNEEIIEKITKGPAPMARIQITLDGPRDIHDSKRKDKTGISTYDRIIEKLFLLRGEMNVDIRINVDNTMSCDQVLELTADLYSKDLIGFYNEKRMSFYLAPLSASTEKCQQQSNVCFTRPEFSKFAREVYKRASPGPRLVAFPETKPLFCGLLSRSSYAIDSKGRIAKCWEAMGNSKRSIGNVAKPLSLRSKVLREWLLHDPLIDGSDCSKCKYLPICMGGCPEVLMTQGRTPDVCDHIKWEIKERLTNATEVYLTFTKHRLGNTQLFNKIVRKEFAKNDAHI